MLCFLYYLISTVLVLLHVIKLFICYDQTIYIVYLFACKSVCLEQTDHVTYSTERLSPYERCHRYLALGGQRGCLVVRYLLVPSPSFLRQTRRQRLVLVGVLELRQLAAEEPELEVRGVPHPTALGLLEGRRHAETDEEMMQQQEGVRESLRGRGGGRIKRDEVTAAAVATAVLHRQDRNDSTHT